MVTGTRRFSSSHTWVMPTFSPTIALLAISSFSGVTRGRSARADPSGALVRLCRRGPLSASSSGGRPRTSIGEPGEYMGAAWQSQTAFTAPFLGELPALSAPKSHKNRPGLDSGAMNEGSRAAIVAAFLANLGIAVAKLVAFAFTGAASMLAESVHSLADTGNQGLLMLGGHRAKQAADEAHPFGFGRERYFWAFVVAVVLFTLGSGFAMREGIDKLLHPHEIDSPWWAVGTL